MNLKWSIHQKKINENTHQKFYSPKANINNFFFASKKSTHNRTLSN
jgi:hypothetical protein